MLYTFSPCSWCWYFSWENREEPQLQTTHFQESAQVLWEYCSPDTWSSLLLGFTHAAPYSGLSDCLSLCPLKWCPPVLTHVQCHTGGVVSLPTHSSVNSPTANLPMLLDRLLANLVCICSFVLFLPVSLQEVEVRCCTPKTAVRFPFLPFLVAPLYLFTLSFICLIFAAPSPNICLSKLSSPE